jgi:hypothetical protein
MVALVNALVVATVERRGALFLLRRVGATTRRLLSMTTWQTAILDLTARFGREMGDRKITKPLGVT